jgi:hypothetical protein
MIMSKGPKVHKDVALFAPRNVHATARANGEDACIAYVLGELLKAKACSGEPPADDGRCAAEAIHR